MADVEFYYALHGGKPVLVGGGSFEDMDRIQEEAGELNAQVDRDPSAIMSPGTEHTLLELGKLAGREPVAELVVDHYKGLVQAHRDRFVRQLRDDVSTESS